MLSRKILLVFVLSFIGPAVVFCQEKITLETKQISKNFGGIDPMVLTEKLKEFLQKHAVKGKIGQGRSSSNGAAIYEDLTLNDLFIFKVKPSQFVAGWTKNELSMVYRGQLFRLISERTFPEPEVKEITYCQGIGIGNFRQVGSREDLISENYFDLGEPIWEHRTLHLLTTLTSNVSAGDYKGARSINCPSEYFFVPSPQTHYELAFTRTQPFRLVSVEEASFSLETYKYNRISSAGIVTWEPDRPFLEESKQLIPLFVTKLIPPYLKSEILTKQDLVEGKINTAIRNKIYVNLVGIWMYDPKTGEIVSKESSSVKPILRSTVQNQEPQTAVQILSKPRAIYTEEARKNKVEGIVRLRVTFNANGTIGSITLVSSLGYGLSEMAMQAAKGIRFIPAKLDGKEVTTIKLIEFPFFLY